MQSERKFFPGYVLAKLSMNDDVYHLVKNTPKVTGFLGSMGKPQPISEAEAARILNTREEAAAAPKQQVKVDYEIGDSVKVLDGPFATFNGIVEELDFDKNKVKVAVSIFGRATPVELDFEQVERAAPARDGGRARLADYRAGLNCAGALHTPASLPSQ